MKEILNAVAQAIRDQAVALEAVADSITALKQTLARHDSEVAEELKTQIQAVSTQMMADQILTLRQTLARRDAELAEELKKQIEVEQEKNRAGGYDSQVSLAKLCEAIAELPDAGAVAEKKPPAKRPKPSKAATAKA